MFDLGFLIFVSFIAALVGFVIGIGLHRSVGSDANKVRELNKALADAEEKSGEYQQHVAEHFSQTAVMLNELTEKYKDVHQHLASGADQLCRDNQGQSLLSPGSGAAIAGVAKAGAAASMLDEPLQPPLDYAPKSDTASVGTLAEDYGLEKIDLHQQTSADAEDPGAADATAANSTNKESNDSGTAPPNIRAV